LKLLLDTHLLILTAEGENRVAPTARKLTSDPANELFFSTVSLWEIVIKSGLNRPDFQVDARLLRRGLLDNGYQELPVLSEHAIAVDSLPSRDKDLFDRTLVAQSMLAGMLLLTNGTTVVKYGGPTLLVT
jgi:PIN domain nuclease of toxin-antitoxin system